MVQWFPYLSQVVAAGGHVGGVLGALAGGRLGTSWEHLGSVLGRLAYRRGKPPEKRSILPPKSEPRNLKNH